MKKVTDQEVTAWFPSNIFPVQVGVYQRRTAADAVGYAYWNGRRWSFMSWSVLAAVSYQRQPTCLLDLPWRGLANEPKDA